MPIYRQIMDQIRYQIAVGTLRPRQKMPSVRELAEQLAVNQNTVLKVYNQLCAEKVLAVDRGNGTFVADGGPAMPAGERRAIVARILGEAAVQAIHLGMNLSDVRELLEKEYEVISKQRLRSKNNE